MSPAATTIAEPRCGRCGYIVRGLPGLTCPECGSDLREVGIRVGRQSNGGWVLVAVLAIIWGLGLWGAAAVVSYGVEQALPQWSRMSVSCRWQQPASKAYREVVAQADAVVRTDQPPGALPIPRHTLTLVANGGSVSTLDLEYDSNTYRIDGGAPVSVSGQLSAQALAAWMQNAGIDPADDQVGAEIATIVPWLTAPQSGWPRGRGNWSQSSGGPGGVFARIVDVGSGRQITRAWPEPVAAVLALAAWLLGMRWLARRFGPRG